MTQSTLHLEDEFGLVFQLDLQFSDLSLKLKRVLRNTILVIDLQAFQTDLKTERRGLITILDSQKFPFLLAETKNCSCLAM